MSEQRDTGEDLIGTAWARSGQGGCGSGAIERSTAPGHVDVRCSHGVMQMLVSVVRERIRSGAWVPARGPAPLPEVTEADLIGTEWVDAGVAAARVSGCGAIRVGASNRPGYVRLHPLDGGTPWHITQEEARQRVRDGVWRKRPAPAAEAPATPSRDRTLRGVIADPPREVLDGFGRKQGRVWEAFCRELAATVEQSPDRRIRVVGADKSPIVEASQMEACVSAALAAAR